MKRNLMGKNKINSVFPYLLLSLLPNINLAAVEVTPVSKDWVTESLQQKKINGVVMDKSGAPIIGANILV